MKHCSIIATTLLQNSRTRMLLYKNLQKESQILKRFRKVDLSQSFSSSTLSVGRAGGGGGGGGDTHLYVPPHRVGFLRRFGLKTGTKNRYTAGIPSLPALPILLWNQVWFLRELRECMNVFIVSNPK